MTKPSAVALPNVVWVVFSTPRPADACDPFRPVGLQSARDLGRTSLMLVFDARVAFGPDRTMHKVSNPKDLERANGVQSKTSIRVAAGDVPEEIRNQYFAGGPSDPWQLSPWNPSS